MDLQWVNVVYIVIVRVKLLEYCLKDFANARETLIFKGEKTWGKISLNLFHTFQKGHFQKVFYLHICAFRIKIFTIKTNKKTNL